MTALLVSPHLLLGFVLLLLFLGVLTLLWGRRMPHQGSWMAGAGLAVLAAGWVTALIGQMHSVSAMGARTWSVGWIWPRGELGSVSIGVLEDPRGLLMGILAILFSILAMIQSLCSKDAHLREERFFSALLFSVSGVALAWIALTPWVALFGLCLAIFGGFLSFGSRWDLDRESFLAIRFAYERSWSLVLVILGGCLLSISHGSLNWAGEGALTGAGSDSTADQVGAWMLAMGLFAQFQSFPFLGWLLEESEVTASQRLLMTQIFPAWIAFAVFLRMEAFFRAVGVFPLFTWISLGSVLFSLCAEMFQSRWKLRMAAWVASGFGIVVAILAFTGPRVAWTFFLGLIFGAYTLSVWGVSLEEGGNGAGSHKKRAIWSKIGIFFSAAIATGMVGFISAEGVLGWLASSWEEPVPLVVFCLAFFLWVLLGWKQAWTVSRLKQSTQASWSMVLSPFVLILMAMGWAWNGTASAGVIQGGPDAFLPSLLRELFGADSDRVMDESIYLQLISIYGGCMVVGLLLAFWLTGRQKESWEKLRATFPKFETFVGSGFGIDFVVGRAFGAMRALGDVLEKWVGSRVWGEYVPKLLSVSVQKASVPVAAVDTVFTEKAEGLLRRWVDVGARFFQLIQNGDVQWYLFFALGSGIAILIHFLVN